MSLDVTALRTSFDLIVEQSPEVVHSFYDVLFARYPETRALFSPGSRDKQNKMLTQALVSVLDRLEDAPWLELQLKALGAKHVSYGVADEMYAWVGECLLVALEMAAGDGWTVRVEKAWTEAYGAISGLMLEGAREERETLKQSA